MKLLARAGRWLSRRVRRFLEIFFADYRCVRRALGGKWERWWCDITCSQVWIKVDVWTPGGLRPPGCEIYSHSPAPLQREDFTEPCTPDEAPIDTGWAELDDELREMKRRRQTGGA